LGGLSIGVREKDDALRRITSHEHHRRTNIIAPIATYLALFVQLGLLIWQTDALAARLAWGF
jgi:hypothetical protein